MNAPETPSTPPPAAPYCDQCGEPVAGAGAAEAEAPAHAGCARRAELEPPRYCARCRRRMVVQVTPRGWTAKCVEHGVRTG